MYRTAFILGRSRMTFAKKWRLKREMVGKIQRNQIYDLNAMIEKCDTMEKLNKMETMIKKKKKQMEDKSV